MENQIKKCKQVMRTEDLALENGAYDKGMRYGVTVHKQPE